MEWTKTHSTVVMVAMQVLLYSNSDSVLSISGACNLATQIKDLYTYVWKKN